MNALAPVASPGMLKAVTRPALIYIRVSGVRQALEGVSLEAQERFCRQRAELLELEVVGLFSDALTGKDAEHRPGLDELKAAAKALTGIRGAEDPVVIVYAISRLTRRQRDFCNLIDAKGAGLNLVSVTEPIDMSTPMGRAMAGMLAVFAQLEGDMISSRTKDALSHVKIELAAQGKRLGNPHSSETLPAATKALILELDGAGASSRAIAAKLNDLGLRASRGGRWTYDNVLSALKVLRREASL